MKAEFIYSFLVALLSSLALVPLLIRNAGRIGLVDDPTGNARKIHAETMPRSGGIAIVAATSIALLVALPLNSQVVSYVLASLIIVAFGLLDDVFELSPLQKLGGQSLGVIVAMIGGMVFIDFPLFSGVPVWKSGSARYCV